MTAVGSNLFIVGGQDPVTGTCYDDIIMVDTTNWQWSMLQVSGSKPPARHSHSTGLVHKNTLIVFGGAGAQGPLGDLWTFDIEKRQWSQPTTTGEMPAPREMHTGTMVDDTRMLIYGGRGPDGKVLCDASLFDAGSLAWKLREPTPFARCAHTAVALPSGLPLVVLSLCEGIRRNAHGTYEVPGMAKRLHSLEASSKTMCCSGFPAAGFTPPLSTSAASLTSRWCAAEAGCSGNQQSDTDEPMGTGEEAEHMCVLVYGGFSGDAVEGDLISIDPDGIDVQMVSRGPDQTDSRPDLQIPQARFAHGAVRIPSTVVDHGKDMVIFGGVNPAADLNDVAIWQGM